MRPPRLRFTLRIMMVAVAIAGAAIGAYALKLRSEESRRKAIGWGEWRALFEGHSATLERTIVSLEREVKLAKREVARASDERERRAHQKEVQDWEAMIVRSTMSLESNRAHAARAAALHRTSERAARRPWLPSEPVPPAPE